MEFRKFGDVIQLLTYCFRSCNRREWLKPGRSFRGVKQSLSRWLDHTYGYPVGLSPRRLFHVVSLIFNILLSCPDFLVLNHEKNPKFLLKNTWNQANHAGWLSPSFAHLGSSCPRATGLVVATPTPDGTLGRCGETHGLTGFFLVGRLMYT